MNRNEETTAVKRAIKAAGIGVENVRVSHGKGTAWGWLTVSGDIRHAPGCTCVIRPDAPTERCLMCRDLWRDADRRIIAVALLTTGRRGDYDGRIGVELGFVE